MASKTLLLGTVFNPPDLGQTQSLLFDAGGELAQISAATLGFVDNWSIAVWAKNDLTGSPGLTNVLLFGVRPTGNENNAIMLSTRKGIADLSVFLKDNSGNIRQSQKYDDVIGGTSIWHHYVVTWDGNIGGMKMYYDSVLTAPSSTSADQDSSTMVDQSRKIIIGGWLGGAGNRWVGPIYSAALYNTVIDQANVTAMYNGGNARDMDLLADAGNYDSATYLQDYYRVGMGTTDASFGLDRGVDATDRNLLSGYFTSSNLTSDIPL
jgi:hypothetical protein